MLYYFKTLPRADPCQLLPKHKGKIKQPKCSSVLPSSTLMTPQMKKTHRKQTTKNPNMVQDYITFASLGCGAEHGKAHTEVTYILNIQQRNSSS